MTNKDVSDLLGVDEADVEAAIDELGLSNDEITVAGLDAIDDLLGDADGDEDDDEDDDDEEVDDED